MYQFLRNGLIQFKPFLVIYTKLDYGSDLMKYWKYNTTFSNDVTTALRMGLLFEPLEYFLFHILHL